MEHFQADDFWVTFFQNDNNIPLSHFVIYTDDLKKALFKKNYVN